MPATPAMPAVADATLTRWAAAGNKSQKVAAWAASQPPGTIVPADDVLIARLPEITGQYGFTSANNPACTRRAIRLLADRHVLRRDRDTGHYHVAATGPAGPDPRRLLKNRQVTPPSGATPLEHLTKGNTPCPLQPPCPSSGPPCPARSTSAGRAWPAFMSTAPR